MFMNCLNTLKANTMIYACLVEAQTSAKQFQASRAHAQLHARSVSDFHEGHRKETETEQRTLISQANYLAEGICLFIKLNFLSHTLMAFWFLCSQIVLEKCSLDTQLCLWASLYIRPSNNDGATGHAAPRSSCAALTLTQVCPTYSSWTPHGTWWTSSIAWDAQCSQ